MMEVPEHEHPLKLVDLHVNVEDVQESDNEEKDLVIQDEFVCPCHRCGQDINEYYRYCYKCIMDDSCDYSLHKFCAELPITLKHSSHSHPLTFSKFPFSWACYYCQRDHKDHEGGYMCLEFCRVLFDVSCVIEGNKRRIHHPSHPHPLVSPISNPIVCKCKACGWEHKGVFLLCTTCSNFAINTECAFLPKIILIQQPTNGFFQHTHPLTLSYSFPRAEQDAKYYPICRVCNRTFFFEDLWIYKCEKCIYYVHLDCAKPGREYYELFPSSGEMVKKLKDAIPELLCLPFPDQTYSILKHLFSKETGPRSYGIGEVSQQHINHQHELVLVDTQCIDALGGSTSSKINSLIMCHNPMKKMELVCNGCLRPIMEMPFYKCGANKDESCNFALHEWCTRLPTKVENHPGHPQHTLVLLSNLPSEFFSIFSCAVCELPCNGFSYGCVKCKYYIDVNCGFIPEKITHKSHYNHLLFRVPPEPFDPVPKYCVMCHSCITWPRYGANSPIPLYFTCHYCKVHIHARCALLLPETIRHPYDKHPMHLSYLPIENHKSEYFCEICENGLNPHVCFYHCDVCAQSVHSACAPLIIQSETETYSGYKNGIYSFSNIKFGRIHKTEGHPHPLKFAQGIADDGQCSMCHERLQYKMIFKCLECKFAIDDVCCKRLNNS